jgi:HD superfamily phosphodiesterase
MKIDDFIVEKGMFDHESYIHGCSHTCRVMALAWEIASRVGNEEERIAAFCAAYIHDLARTNDGLCRVHGQRAADTKLPVYRDFFRSQGLTDTAMEAVYTAVCQHSLAEEIDKNHPHYRITAILKDADALDRIRLGPFELNPDFLRFPESRDLIRPAVKLFRKTLFRRKLSPLGCVNILQKTLPK